MALTLPWPVLLMACASHTSLPVAPRTHLDSLAQAPERAGSLVYEGHVTASAEDLPSYRYQRRVTDTPQGTRASHITFDRDQTVVVVQTVSQAADASLTAFEEVHRQTGAVSRLVVSDDEVHYTSDRDGVVRTRTEALDGLLVTGPTLFEVVRRHWDDLLAGTSLRVRFAVTDRRKSYGFVLRVDRRDDTQVVFTFRPTDPLVRLAVPTSRLTFDQATREPVLYEGRVPPLHPTRGSVLDAVVTYAPSGPYR